MKILQTILLVLLMTQGLNIASGQEPAPVSQQIEDSVKQDRLVWKLTKKTVSKDGKSLSYRWKAKRSSLELLLLFNSSEELAIDRFKTLPIDLELNGLPMKTSATDLRVGDQSLSWGHQYDRRIVGILFRKGTVVANVSGTGKSDVTRIASHIADAIPALSP